VVLSTSTSSCADTSNQTLTTDPRPEGASETTGSHALAAGTYIVYIRRAGGPAVGRR